jgi:hypothetical protein
MVPFAFMRLAPVLLLFLAAACNSADSTPMPSCLEDGCAAGLTCNAVSGVCETRLQLTAAAETGGAVATTGSGCTGTSCSVLAATQVTLTATAEAGYRFLAWSGGAACADETANPLVVTVTESQTCTATFVRRFTVRGTVTGAETSVEATAPSADPATCEASQCEVDTGKTVVLTAPVVPGFWVSGWTGEGCPTEGSQINVTADADRTCTATYAPGLVVAGMVTGRTGTVTATSEAPAKLCEANQCTVPPHASVVLTRPTDIPRGRWIGWFGEGACTGTETSVTIADVTEAASCEARYEPRLSATGLVDGPTAVVTVDTLDSEEICEPGVCYLQSGYNVTFDAPEVSGWQFSHWSGDCDSTESSVTLQEISSDVECTAHYDQFFLVTGVPSNEDAEINAQTEAYSCDGASCLVPAGTRVEFYVSGFWAITGVEGEGCSTDDGEGGTFAYLESAMFDGQTCDIEVAPFIDIRLTSQSNQVEFQDYGELD